MRRGQGLERYATPDRAFRDTAWKRDGGGGTSHARRELNTAGVWWSVLSVERRADLARHRSAYASAWRGQETVRDTMREALATT
ncbi:hypothetical protein OHB53_18725 [Streptomyces sp. NBC_00056]|uniref:hypothetical protein n=1 Tax=Streptomyces sp. NBC_00056 TaxID=2975633 RepID=UPI0032563071